LFTLSTVIHHNAKDRTVFLRPLVPLFPQLLDCVNESYAAVGDTGLTNRKAARLEINTSVPYMIRATYLVLASRVYAVKRFLACPFTFIDSPGHAGVLHIRDMRLRTHQRSRRFAQ